MPNHVVNVLHLKDIGKKKELFQEDEQTLDFNKIKPMPESLNITDGSIIDASVAAYLLSIAKGVNNKIYHTEWHKEMMPVINVPPKMIKRLNEMEFPIEYYNYNGAEKKEYKDIWDLALLGKQYIDNIFLYGSPTWYYWCCENWGTKWNAYDGAIIDDDTIEFETAWSPADQIGVELSLQNPDELISITYANEDPSSTGRMEFYNGQIITDNEYEYGTQKSVDTYYNLWDYNYLDWAEYSEKAFGILAFSYEEVA